MHSALVIIEQPASLGLPKFSLQWGQCIKELKSAAEKHKSAVERLGDGCALVTMAQGADALSDVLAVAEAASFPYRVLFFKKAPAWIRTERPSIKT